MNDFKLNACVCLRLHESYQREGIPQGAGQMNWVISLRLLAAVRKGGMRNGGGRRRFGGGCERHLG